MTRRPYLSVCICSASYLHVLLHALRLPGSAVSNTLQQHMCCDVPSEQQPVSATWLPAKAAALLGATCVLDGVRTLPRGLRADTRLCPVPP